MVYVIIVVSTLSALLFHFYLYRLIKRWAERDFLRSLCEDDEEKLQFLETEYANVIARRLKRDAFEAHFNQLATDYEQQRTKES
ncbi:hypothetical protein MIB92_17605 [Aestuariirhabdus sp. Z084]|uniref:hypothetical protein n=1 Tax=Aestuariirhabdus haliotis TaxID=2918751 RepID=UPI00201B3690|nr:hypothetical protein [Aestuariirhabdus haliotis]MCL6417481.1 hypothetical protein [Aestuariirhabdus haliotis]MCL6421433.1 hypothetical protein [Aestuariirhabdus haliotis]